MSALAKLQNRLQKIKQELGPVELVAVTKYSENRDLELAYQCGLRDFGENRVDELLRKSQWVKSQKMTGVRWHFIGHLQSNKLSRLLECEGLVAIHSVDSLSILEKILKHPPAHPLDIYLQVKTSFEDEKYGFDSNDAQWSEALSLLSTATQKINFKGLMTMAPIRVENVSHAAQESFFKLKILRDEIAPKFNKQLELSMGMSGDYLTAIEQGATVVRLGSVLFDDLEQDT